MEKKTDRAIQRGHGEQVGYVKQLRVECSKLYCR